MNSSVGEIKIILFRSGFAGDLIIALHNMDCFRELTPEGKIELDKEVIVLQGDAKDISITEKNLYLKCPD